MSGWNFREPVFIIEYKAALGGVSVVYVNLKETSKTCPQSETPASRYNHKKQAGSGA